VFVPGKGTALGSKLQEPAPVQAGPGGLDAATLASLRAEIRAGFKDAFAPLRTLATDMERTMRKVSATLSRMTERRGPPK
jgi:hypothetical protein